MSPPVRRPSPWQTLKSIGLSMAVTARNFFRPPATVMYPEQARAYPERFRALVFALTHDPETGEENCIGCMMCEHICPAIAIKVVPEKHPDKAGKTRGWAKEFYLDLNTCIFCELCVQVCPTDAIVMTKVWEASVYERRDFVLDKDALHANETKYPLAWATGSRLREMQGPPAPAKAPAPASAAAVPAARPPGSDGRPGSPAGAARTAGSAEPAPGRPERAQPGAEPTAATGPTRPAGPTGAAS